MVGNEPLEEEENAPAEENKEQRKPMKVLVKLYKKQ